MQAVKEYKKLQDVSARVTRQVELYRMFCSIILTTFLEKYIAQTATNTLNLSAQLLQHMRPTVENGYGQIDLFDPLLMEVKFDLSSNTFARFKQRSTLHVK